MPADPILASNPLDTRTFSYHDLAAAYGELWRKAAALQVECATNRRLLDKAQAENVRLSEAARYENEKVRSLSASVKELKEALAVARRLGAKYAEMCDEAIAAGRAAVLREREECASAMDFAAEHMIDRKVAAALRGGAATIRSRGGQ